MKVVSKGEGSGEGVYATLVSSDGVKLCNALRTFSPQFAVVEFLVSFSFFFLLPVVNFLPHLLVRSKMAKGRRR